MGFLLFPQYSHNTETRSRVPNTGCYRGQVGNVNKRSRPGGVGGPGESTWAVHRDQSPVAPASGCHVGVLSACAILWAFQKESEIIIFI